MRVVDNLYFLQSLAHSTSTKKRHLIIDWATNEHIRTVSELFLNILRGVVPLPNHLYYLLNKNKTIIRKLANRKVTFSVKRRILRNKGKPLIDSLSEILEIITKIIPEFHHSRHVL